MTGGNPAPEDFRSIERIRLGRVSHRHSVPRSYYWIDLRAGMGKTDLKFNPVKVCYHLAEGYVCEGILEIFCFYFVRTITIS